MDNLGFVNCNNCLDCEVRDSKGNLVRECPKHYKDLKDYVKKWNADCPYVLTVQRSKNGK